MSKSSYIRGAGILAIGGLTSRFIGLFYKAAISKILGSYAMGLYYNSYFVLGFALSFVISAVPLSLSKMIAEKRALGGYRGVRKVVVVVALISSAIGIIFTCLILRYGRTIIAIAGWDENTYYPLMGLSFAPMLISFVCIFRGYFQGISIMEPTASSQIAESFARLVIGVPLCYYLTKSYDSAFGAGGAALGSSLSEGAGLAVMLSAFLIYRRKYAVGKSCDSTSVYSIARRFFHIAIPLSITAFMLSLNGMVNSFTYAPRLEAAGIALKDATKMFGDYSNASTLINIPMTISMAIATAILPSIAESNVKGDVKSICRKTNSAMRIVFVVGFPCIIGLSMFSQEIFTIVFNETPYGGPILKLNSLSIIFIMLSSTLMSILQGMDAFASVIKNIGIGIVVRLFLNYWLIGIPNLNINGLIISNIISFGVIALLNMRAMKERTGFRLELYHTVCKPLFSSVIMGVFAKMFGNLAFKYLGQITSIFVIVVFSVVFYISVLIATKTIREEDMDMIPSGEKFKKIYGFFK